jgi:large subunit ribosomal protein L17
MRHLKGGKRLGVTTSHRKAMMRNLVTALLEHGEIRTTITKAKQMRKYFDKMIGLGKRDSLHTRRQALSFIKSKDVVKKLFEEYGPLYENRNGGYTRIYRLGRRLGDNSQMALIQMVGLEGSAEPVKEVATDTIDEVKEELQSEEQDTQPAADSSEAEESASEGADEDAQEASDTEPEADASEEPPASEEEASASETDDSPEADPKSDTPEETDDKDK